MTLVHYSGYYTGHLQSKCILDKDALGGYTFWGGPKKNITPITVLDHLPVQEENHRATGASIKHRGIIAIVLIVNP